MTIVVRPTAEHSVKTSQLSWLKIFRAFYCLSLFSVLFDLSDGRIFLGDSDDSMRELQVRQLFMGGGHWFDTHLPQIAMPEAYLSPWSRLVDLPFLVLAKFFSPIFGAEQALELSFQVWPPILLGIFCVLTASIFHRQYRAGVSLTYLILLTSASLMIYAIWEFAPGRIDHHNMQIIGLMAIGAGLMHWTGTGGVLTGCGTVMCIVVGLEGLPFIATTFLGLAACFTFGIQGSREILAATTATVVLLTMPTALLVIGPAGILSTHCDALSAPYIFLLLGYPAILLIATQLANGWSTSAKATILIICGVVLLAATAALFPRCLAGPYWMVDALSRQGWLDRLSQEHGLLYHLQQGQLSIVLVLTVLLCVLVAAAPAALRHSLAGNVGLFILYTVAASTLLATFLQTRYIRFSFALIPLLLPLALQTFAPPIDATRVISGRVRKMTVIVLSCIVMGVIILRELLPPIQATPDAITYMAYSDCRDQDFSVMLTVFPGKIALPHGLGLPVALTAPQGFSVAAVPFHRAAPGIKRMLEAFTTHDSTVRRAALQPFDYLAVCKFPLAVDANQAPLYAELAKGGSWPGLELIPPSVPTNFQLFRINHETLR